MSAVGEPRVFDLAGPLPGGTTVLEASAGTGKTFTIAGLVTRYLASGAATVEEVLVVTFGRAASQELRARVRERLVAAERLLGAPDPDAAAAPSDPVDRWLLDADHEERRERRERLRAALAAFDAAVIATTHQFCQLVLRSLGVAGDTEPGARLVDSLDELLVEVVDDVYLRLFGDAPRAPALGRSDALAIARAVVSDGLAALAPPSAAEAADPASPGGLRVRLAHEVRAEVARRKAERGLLSYDDLLARVAEALADADAPARARLRHRWRFVLVDEFQDTDPTQWQVLERAFHGHATLVLIGDPKQAIYGFRGGDVVTYLRAAHVADGRATLAVNHRSDEPLVRSLGVLLGGAALGEDEIVVRGVGARLTEPRLVGAPSDAPVRLRHLRRDGLRTLRSGLVRAQIAREAIAEDCAADIAALLASGATWCGAPVEAAHVAVIVDQRDHGRLVADRLTALGVPSVLSGGGHLLATPAADAWVVLLEALEQPHRSPRVRAAALGCFLGRTALELAGDPEAGERLTDAVADRLRTWSVVLRDRGVAALVEVLEAAGLSERVLGQHGGERLLTDLRHLGHLLHETAVRERFGLTALLQWLREERRLVEGARGERPRRLDSDAEAVQIVTVHGSKGLQYPVVYLPFAATNYRWPVAVAQFHDDGGRTLDVRGAGAGWEAHAERHRAEEAGEELRRLYVALTRAQSQVVTWWAGTTTTPDAALHRVLLGRRPGAAVVPATQRVRDDDTVHGVLRAWSAEGAFALEVVDRGRPVAPLETPVTHEPLALRTLDRAVDAAWTRTSYSGLIRVEEHLAPPPTSEPEVAVREDEVVEAVEALAALEPVEVVEPVGVAGDPAAPPPWAALPAGAAFGSLVHAVLEHADPAAPAHAGDLRAELRHHVLEQARWWPTGVEPEALADPLADALVAVHRTPLGPLAGGLTLADLGRTERLRELDFEIPLDGGDRRRARGGGPGPGPRLRDLGPLLRAHLAPDDPLAAYADRLEVPPLGDQPLRGYLAGSIDVVLRVPDAAVGHRYLVVDYKTNRLAPADPAQPPSAADYEPGRLAEAMLHSHYPLQALLYSAVVHRYLRWRVPGYRPATHLGGVLYLYLRGMVGPDVEPDTPGGVFAWRPPADLVVALSDLLDGRTTSEVTA